MDERTKELIAIGASVTANCVACFRHHHRKAREAGAEPEEVREAIRVGRMVRRGAASTWDQDARALLSGENSDPKQTQGAMS